MERSNPKLGTGWARGPQSEGSIRSRRILIQATTVLTLTAGMECYPCARKRINQLDLDTLPSRLERPGRGQITLVDRRVLESIASGTEFAVPEQGVRD